MFHPLLEKALEFALSAHEGQERKGQAATPYVVHPLHVGLILTRYQFAEPVCAAGILHDVVEDCDVELVDIEVHFGIEVAGYVAEVSEDKGMSWTDRKQATITAVATMSRGAQAVLAADKLHNLADVSRQEDQQGDEAWSIFQRGKEGTLGYYRGVTRQLQLHFPHPLTSELAAVLSRWA